MGLSDWHEMNLLLRYLRPGDEFIDIGANIGIYSLLAGSRVGLDGKVYCFEPDTITFHKLKQNIQLK